MFEVAQYDSYSYLFDKATYINLDPDVSPSNIPLKGMRIGINGSEASVGQAYRNLDTSIDGASYDPATGQPLSSLGTIIALENGPDSDEFFLTFELLGDQTGVVTEVSSPLTPPPLPTPADPVSDIGVRTFDEINASMAAITGVDPQAVKAEFDVLRQQLPAVETIEAFLSAHQMAIAQLGIAYCDTLVRDTSKRADFFGWGADVNSANIFFTSPVSTAFGSGDTAAKNQIVDALFDRVVGFGGTLITAPSQAHLKTELIGPTATNPDNLFDRLAANCLLATDPPCSPDAARTQAVVKAMCASVLSSAAVLVQ
jgi:hypothetical protein